MARKKGSLNKKTDNIPISAVITPKNIEVAMTGCADALELAELIAIRDGMTKRGIIPDSKLGILIDNLERKVK